MRRIYESAALAADDENPFAPNERVEGSRTLDWANASHALVPTALRRHAIALDVQTDRGIYAREEVVRFRVRMRNRLPIPVTLRTTSALPWSWALDGLERASRLDSRTPDEPGVLRFGRGETKRFERRWHQRIRESAREWSPACPGSYTLRAWVNHRDGPLSAETTFRIE